MSVLLNNKKAYFDYEILNKFEAGIELFGFEVKTLREKQGSINESYISIKNNEVFLISANIPAYQQKNAPEDFDQYRNRKLLLHKKEIIKLKSSEKEKGLTIIALKLYNKGSLIKIEIAVARGKKKYDKRSIIKKRESKREIERTLKRE